MDTIQQSRRAFIKTAGLAALTAAAGAGLAGCASGGNGGSANANDAATSLDQINWDEEFDVVVVGAGAAGLSSAITVATEGNGATCLLIEKGEEGPEGCSAVSGGRCIWTTDADLFHTYMVGLYDGEPTTPDEVLRAFAEGATENLNWILSLGPNVDEMTIEEPGEPSPSQPNCYPEYPELEGSLSVGSLRVGIRTDGGEVTGPRHIALFLREKVEKDFADAIDYRLGTPLTALVQDPETKEIVGIVAESKGKSIYVKANKGVIMCLGGFEANPEMMWNYFCQKSARCEAGIQGNTGDGHKICAKIGAAFWHMNSIAGFAMATYDNEETSIIKTNQQYGINVGTSGRRFFMDLGGLVAGPSYPVTGDLATDVNVRHGHMNNGGDWPHLSMANTSWFICDANGLAAGAYPKNEDPVGDKVAYTADTLEDLATAIGIPADELVKTVNVWNGYCETGEDLSFYRPASYMINASITTPPFFASICHPSFLNTDGGPVRNEKGQILDLEGEVIPRLYAAGEFGSIWTNMYQGACNIGEGMIFGRIAVRDMLELPAKEYPNPYVSNKPVGTLVDDAAAITAAVGVVIDAPEGADNVVYKVYEDQEIGQVEFSYEGNNFVQRAKLTSSFEDVADSASVNSKQASDGSTEYTIYYTQPAGSEVATYTAWYDAAGQTSRSLVSKTSQDEHTLVSLTEKLIAMY